MTAPQPPTSNARARELLVSTGAALYGQFFIKPLARGLEISFDSVRDWINGKNARFDMSHPAWDKIARMLEAEHFRLAAVAEFDTASEDKAEAIAATLAAIRKETHHDT
jgi:hypothetical protein